LWVLSQPPNTTAKSVTTGVIALAATFTAIILSLERDQCGDHSTGHIVTGKCLPDAVGRGGRRDAAGRLAGGDPADGVDEHEPEISR
jgi:hypothetical protein